MPFDNLSGIEAKKFNIGLFILLTFLALLGTILIPGLGLLGSGTSAYTGIASCDNGEGKRWDHLCSSILSYTVFIWIYNASRYNVPL